MRRGAAGLALLVLVLCAPPADARFKQREQTLAFLRWDRGTAANVALRATATVTTISLASSKTDTTAVFDCSDLIPPPIAATTDGADTNRVIGRLFLTADSSAAGSLTAITVACHCVTGSTRSSGVEQSHSYAVVSKSYTTMGSKRGYSFPIVQTLTPAAGLAAMVGDPSSQGGLLLCPRMRFVFSGITGAMGAVRATINYYADMP